MNRRIRKKKHLGEFDYKGFEVSCFYSELDLAEATAFMDGVIVLAEANSLTCGGSFGKSEAHFVVTRVISRRAGDKRRRGCTHCTESDRKLIGDYLKAQTFMGDVRIGALEAMWR